MKGDATRLEQAKISVFLRSARSALGTSQTDLAMELDISQSAIARLERGTGTIPANVLLRAIRYFAIQGIDISGLLESDPQINFSEKFFQEFADRIKSEKDEAGNSGSAKQSARRPKTSSE